MKLNIIGNGFDLYYGLPSRYADFANWLIENDESIYQAISKFFGIQIYEAVQLYYDIEDGDYIIQERFWSDFENELGNVDSSAFEEQLINDLGLENDDPVSLRSEVEADSIAEDLKRKFAEWIYNSVDTKANYRIIRRNMRKKDININFSSQDKFIVFNYTHTLQNIHKIPNDNIFYIHGECLDDDSYLTVGHGNDSALAELANQISIEETEYDYTQSSRNSIDEKECMLSFMKSLRKDVEVHLMFLTDFLKEISPNVDEIVVYGFSFGDVDMPYIREINQMCKNATWKISMFTYNAQKERELIYKLGRKCADIEEKKCFGFEFQNPLCGKIRDEIRNEQHCSDYLIV
jgi:hypothetical protein